MNYTQKPKICSNVRHGKKQIIRTRKKQIITARREIEDLRNDTHAKKELDNWQRVKYFLVVGRFPAGRERNEMAIKLNALIDVLSEIEDVLPEIRDTDIYKSAWKQFHEDNGGDTYGDLTNKGQAHYLKRILDEMSLEDGEIMHLGGDFYGVTYPLRDGRYALVSTIHGTHLSATIYENNYFDADLDSVELELETTPLRDALKIAYYFVRYYHPRTN